MGVCETKNNNNEQKEKFKPKVAVNPYSIEADTTGIFQKYNYSSTNLEEIKKQNNGYLLPTALSKRDDIRKYYNLHEKLLGEGAYGQVCTGVKNGMTYAIKRIKKDKLKEIKTILLEAEISLQIKHENIITYYEIFEDAEFISYVMDLGEGGDLFDFIVGCPLGHLPADIVIELLIQIFDVVDYLHSVKGIIHRDLKPENFLIKIDMFNKPQVKLIDFGLATYIPKNGQRLKEFLGTREYAAPEIHENSGYLEKVDEWAIGVIMYNMLTGFEPFKGESPSEIKDSVLFSQIQFDVIEDVDLREINKQLLNRFVAKRITCKEALVELKRIQIERKNYYLGQKRLVKKTPSTVLKKEFEEVKEYMNYWDNITTKVHGLNLI